MAVTKIWAVKGRVDKVLSYVKNPEKTDTALRDALHYAVNDMKTEKGFYVTGINCDPETAEKQFTIVKRQFGKEGGIIAYHAYQSFAADEVNPKEAHEIGLQLAGKLWGKDYQVIVATHLNTDCLHNHFVINSVSFKNGMRCRAKEWQELAKASDDICKARNLQIIEESKGRGLAYQIYLAEKRGEPTRLNLAKAALDEALSCSASLRELEQRLRARGYIGNFEPGRKYWTLRQKDWQRPIRIQRMGKDYTNEGIMQKLKGVKETSGLETISFFRHRAVPQYRLPKRIHKIRKRGGLQGLYLHYCYLLGYLPKYRQNPKKVYYLYRDDLIKLRSISAEARFLAENQIESKEQLAAKKAGNEKLIENLQIKRCELRNMLRHVGVSEKEKKEIREKIAAISLQMKQFRREIHLCDSIERRTAVITERIRTGEREIEKQRQR